MRISRVVALSLLGVSSGSLLVVACGGATQPAHRDLGGPVAADASVDDTAVADAGAEAGVFLSPLACGPVERIDTEGGVSNSHEIVAASFAGKILVSWQQDSTGTATRFFDGTSWLAPISFDPGANALGRIVVDGAGKAFLSSRSWYQNAPVARRTVFDFETGVFAAPTAFAADLDGETFQTIDVAALPGGGALYVYRAVDGVRADRWSPDTGAWGPSQIIAPRADNVRVASNAAGQAVAFVWTTDLKANAVSRAVTFDGSAWSAPSAPRSGTVQAFRLGALPSGEGVIFTTGAGSPFEITRVRPGLGGGACEFLAAESVVSEPTPGGRFTDLAVDALGRVTVAWTAPVIRASYLHDVFTRRYVNGGWAETQLLAHADTTSLAVDPVSKSVVALTESPVGSPVGHVGAVSVQRVAADANTWSAPVSTGIANPFSLDLSAAVGFRSGGAAVVFSRKPHGASSDLGLFAATCD
jgi:hypothetical protein